MNVKEHENIGGPYTDMVLSWWVSTHTKDFVLGAITHPYHEINGHLTE